MEPYPDADDLRYRGRPRHAAGDAFEHSAYVLLIDKHGEQRVEYLDPRLQPILSPTYGIMVYQEQVMQIAQVIGGYTLGGADLLRRAMGKKKQEEMDAQRDLFVAGAEKNGLTKAKATALFDLMAKFAGYGFNKSHAAAYALLLHVGDFQPRSSLHAGVFGLGLLAMALVITRSLARLREMGLYS